MKWGAQQSNIDHRLYVLSQSNGGYIITIVVVDDMALSLNNGEIIPHSKQSLTRTFMAKLFGALREFIA